MIVAMFGVIITIGSGLFLLKDKRSFFAGLFLFAGVLLLLISGIMAGLNVVMNSSQDANNAVILFTLIGMITLPVFVGLALILNTRVMQVKEGKSLTAKLSLFFGCNLIMMAIVSFLILRNIYTWPNLVLVVLFWGLMVDATLTFILLGYLFYSFMYQVLPIKYQADYVITLGAGVRSDQVSPLLKSRLDRAIEYFRNYSNSKSLMIPSGGQGPDEPYPEAVVMAKYLRSQQIPEEKIMLEDKSTSTFENMLFSKQKIEEDWQKRGENRKPKVVFSTNNYHVLRGAIYAKRAGLDAQGVGAPTSFYFLPSAMLREYIALLSIYRWMTIGIIIFWGLISLLIFVH